MRARVGFGALLTAGLCMVACSVEPGGSDHPAPATQGALGTLDQPAQPGEQGCGPKISCDDGNPCTVDSCVRGQGCIHTNADGALCDDSNACTQTDTCVAGSCIGSNPVVCTAEDVCHTVGTCDPTSGVCSNPALPNGAAVTGGTCFGGVLVLAPSISGCGMNISLTCPTVTIPCNSIVDPWPPTSVDVCASDSTQVACYCGPSGKPCGFGGAPAAGTYTCYGADFTSGAYATCSGVLVCD